MTDDQMTRLFELKKRLDAGEITKEMFDLGVAAIRGTDKSENANPKPSINPNSKRIIIGVIIAVVVLLGGGLFLLLHSNPKTEEAQMCPSNVNYPDENRIRSIVSGYCTAICENDFETLFSLYAPIVLRYQDAYDKDRDYVIGCHQRYDNTFKVYGKHSSLRWDSFVMEPSDSRTVNVTIVEDYSIDRQDKSKYSVFVLEKHFTIDSTYHIVSVYDNQLSRSKEANYKALYQVYAKERDFISEVNEYCSGWEYLYIDDDNVPELLICTGYAPIGSYLLSIVNGKVVETSTSEVFSYIPYKNRFLTGRGLHNNIDNVYVETLKSGKIILLATVTADYNDDDNMRDEPLWYVNNEPVSKSEADDLMDELFYLFGQDKAAGIVGHKLRPLDELLQ